MPRTTYPAPVDAVDALGAARIFAESTETHSVKALGEALSDAKYKKVHSFRKNGGCRDAEQRAPLKKGEGGEPRRDTLSSRLAPQASVVKGREVLQIGSPSERVYIVFPLKEPQKCH